MLKGKTVVVGVTGGIAIFKACSVVSSLTKMGANVKVIMTEAAKEFVSPLTFRTLSKNPVYDNMFSSPERWEVEHVELAKAADLIVVCPATANTIAKFAHGIADNPLTTTVLASKAKKLIFPAMNVGMYENEATVENIATLKKRGFIVFEPNEGYLACGDTAKGRMAEPEEIIWEIEKELAFEKDLLGKTVLVTAGPTMESIDPVRFITNHSSGKMGVAIAKAAYLRGADVILVSGKTNLSCPAGIKKIDVVSAEDMYNAVNDNKAKADIIIKAAAVADFTPETKADNKIKKNGKTEMTISLTGTKDILKSLGESKKEGTVLVGFCMETENLIENAKRKLDNKNLDMIVANNLNDKGAGFGVDTNTVTILTRDGKEYTPENMEKEKLSHIILDLAKERL